MNEFLISEFGREHVRQLAIEADQRRLARATRQPRPPVQVWATLVVAAPYEQVAIHLPGRAHGDRADLELDAVLLPRPSGRHEPDAVRVGASWRRSRIPRHRRRPVGGSATVEIHPAGETWTNLTVKLTARRGHARHLERTAWAFAGALRTAIEGAVVEFTVPMLVLAGRAGDLATCSA